MPSALSAREDLPAGEPRAALLIAAFLGIAVLLTFPHVTELGTFIAGDSGDSLLNLWIMRTVQTGLPHGWRALWSPPIFYPTRDALAYSDTLLPVALLHWPLRTVGGDALAVNVISLASWVLSSWCTYRLARRATRIWGVAVVSALAYTYSSIRLVHHPHFQLVVGGALVPATLLAALRCLEAPSAKRGLVLGLAFTTLALTASYDAALMAVVLAIVVGGWVLTDRPALRAHAVALGVAALVVGACVGPIDGQYLRLLRRQEFRRGFDPQSAAHLEDFLSTGPGNYVLTRLPVIGSRSRPESRGIENRLFPGLVALALGMLGALVVARDAKALFTGAGAPPPARTDDDVSPRIRRSSARHGRRRLNTRELALISLAGVVAIVLAFGDRINIGGRDVTLPFAVLRHFAPGFSGIRATARFALGGELALALLSGVGLDALIRARRPATQTLIALVVAAGVIAESAMSLTLVRVPVRSDDGGIGASLAMRPPGAVLELPIESAERGLAWPYVEAPRQLEAIADGHPRVNGYSGFEPRGFGAQAETLNRFPSADALALARSLGVRYVVIRTRLVGALSPAILTPQLDADGVGRYTEQTAARLMTTIPPGSSAQIDHRLGGYIVELKP